MDRDEVEGHKNAKRELSQYPVVSTELTWAIKDSFHGIKNTKKVIFFVFEHRIGSQLFVNVMERFGFPRFLVPSRQRNHRKSFYIHGKYFAEFDFGEMSLREPNGQAWASSIAQACPLG